MPENLVKIGNSSDLSNSLVCTVRNADNVSWVYLKSETDRVAQDLPKAFNKNQKVVQDPNTLDLTVTITDHLSAHLNERPQMNGYYKCIASNQHGYRVETPPIRFIISGESTTTLCLSKKEDFVSPLGARKNFLQIFKKFAKFHLVNFTFTTYHFYILSCTENMD